MKKIPRMEGEQIEMHVWAAIEWGGDKSIISLVQNLVQNLTINDKICLILCLIF